MEFIVRVRKLSRLLTYFLLLGLIAVLSFVMGLFKSDHTVTLNPLQIEDARADVPTGSSSGDGGDGGSDSGSGDSGSGDSSGGDM